MSTLYLDCSMGAAGDMLAAALLELHPDPAGVVARLHALGLPGVVFSPRQAVKCGIVGTHMGVHVHGCCEDGAATEEKVLSSPGEQPHPHDHHGHHSPSHGHGSHGSTLSDIARLVDGLPLSSRVRADIQAVYRLLAEAEGAVHGREMDDIHFHEVGTLDAVADITAVCLLMEELSPRQVLCSPIRTGFGQVHCAHGLLPVPAPATARLLLGVPVYAGDISGELCTPTGAALLRHFVRHFGPMPPMTLRAVGYGMGSRDFPAANCLRAMLGEDDQTGDTVWELACNLDDMTGEAVAFATERLFEAGAVEVYTTPIGMKKGRPGVLLTALCPEDCRDGVLDALLCHSSTLGVRERRCRRTVLERQQEVLDTPFGPATRKTARGHGLCRSKWEYEDLARIARAQGIGLEQARALLDGLGL